jgi:hypothetical protein
VEYVKANPKISFDPNSFQFATSSEQERRRVIFIWIGVNIQTKAKELLLAKYTQTLNVLDSQLEIITENMQSMVNHSRIFIYRTNVYEYSSQEYHMIPRPIQTKSRHSIIPMYHHLFNLTQVHPIIWIWFQRLPSRHLNRQEWLKNQGEPRKRNPVRYSKTWIQAPNFQTPSIRYKLYGYNITCRTFG